jgi:hypothetical protein
VKTAPTKPGLPYTWWEQEDEVKTVPTKPGLPYTCWEQEDEGMIAVEMSDARIFNSLIVSEVILKSAAP